MQKMMIGLFLLLLSIWILIFGVADNAALFCYISIFLLIAAIVVFLLGLSDKRDSK